MKALAVSVVVSATIVALAVLTLGMLSFRFDLVTIKPAFWYLLAGIILFIVGSWVAANGAPIGRWFATGGIVLLGLGVYRAAWPKSAEALNGAQQAVDANIAATVSTATTAKPAPSPTPSPTPEPIVPEVQEIPIPPEFLQ